MQAIYDALYEMVVKAPDLWHYWIVIVLMMIGLYIVISRDNLVKKIMGLNIFQVSVIMFYVAIGKVKDGTAPIITGKLPEGHHHDEGHGADAAGHGAHGADAAGHGAHGADAAGHGAHGADAAGHAADAGHGADAASHVDLECWDNVCPDGLYGMWDVATQACECAAYSNPLPHVLMLTAIVVGVATTALGLALVVRIQEGYGTVEEDDIVRIDMEGA